MDNEFPSNSQRRPEDRKVESVVTSKVVAGKKPVGKRLRDMLFAGDGRSAAHSVFADVILPQIKDMAAEAAREAVERLIFGEGRSSSRRPSPYSRPGVSTTHTNYGSRYSRPSPSRPAREDGPNASIRKEDIEYIVLATRFEAQQVIDGLEELIQKYEMATVADLKDLIEWSTDLTDQKWGWEDLEGTRIAPNRGGSGYVLILPKPQPL